MTIVKTVKVLHLVPPGFGGIDAYVFNHYRHMDREKFRFDFLTRNQELEHAEQYADLDYKVYLLPATAAEDRDAFVRCIRGVLSKGYDVLHLHTPFWTGFLIEELARETNIKRVVVHAHGMSVEGDSEQERLERLNRHNELKKAFRPELATDFWACSHSAAEWLFGEQIPRKKIRIMKNAIDTERFRFSPQKRKELRQELGIEENTLVLGTVGRLTHIKNQAFLINLLSEFRKKHPDTKLIMAGDGELREELESQIAGKGLEKDALLLGWRTNVEDYLQTMDVFLLPSRFEGLGIAAVEAAASGLPCLVSDQVPEDAAVTEHVRHIPLELSAWTAALVEAAQLRVDRQDGAEAVRAAGYDIRQQAKVLEALYES